MPRANCDRNSQAEMCLSVTMIKNHQLRRKANQDGARICSAEIGIIIINGNRGKRQMWAISHLLFLLLHGDGVFDSLNPVGHGMFFLVD